MHFLEAHIHSASQQIHFSQETGSCHLYIRKSPQLDHILSQEPKSHPHKSTAFLVSILLLHFHFVYFSKMISCRFSNERFCISILPARATRPSISSSLNTTVSPLERLTIARVARNSSPYTTPKFSYLVHISPQLSYILNQLNTFFFYFILSP